MHFITGGVCQGKRKWVQKHYRLTNHNDWKWQSAYETALQLPREADDERIHIIEGIEEAIKKSLDSDLKLHAKWESFFSEWFKWEQEDRQLVIIGADISKGIVPMNAKDRQWRDETGWCYQRLVEQADRFDVIWCGIHQTLKLEEEGI